MSSEYNIVMLHNGLRHHYDKNQGTGAYFKESDDGLSITLHKGDSFSDWCADDILVRMANGTNKPICEANRAYLHYVIDCWLDDVPVALQPGELP